MSMSKDPSKQPYKRLYTPKNPEKYRGSHKVVTRSSWEYQFAKWLDFNPNVEWWASEETVVPYRSKLDNKWHRYYLDFSVRFKNGKTVLFEIKPSKQTKPPKTPQRKTKKFLTEVKTYATNVAKWEAAKSYAENNGLSFQILTEHELRKLGLKII